MIPRKRRRPGIAGTRRNVRNEDDVVLEEVRALRVEINKGKMPKRISPFAPKIQQYWFAWNVALGFAFEIGAEFFPSNLVAEFSHALP